MSAGGAERLEEVRAWVEARLEPERAARLEEELARDAELREFAQAYREVWILTEDAQGPAVHSQLSFEDLELRLEERRPAPWLSVAAAAAVVLLVAGLFLREALRRSGPPRLRLEAIPMQAEAPSELAPLPAWLADYRPVREGEIQWISDLAVGVQLSQLCGAPLLIWGAHETCPICARMGDTTFVDASFLARLQGWVPVRLDVMRTSYFEGLDPAENGFPVFELRDDEFEELAVRYGYVEAQDLGGLLEEYGAEDTAAPGLIADILEVREDLRDARWAAAEAELHELEGRQLPAGAQRELSALEARLERAALERLRAALEAKLPAEALSAARREFAGTRFAGDFGRALEAQRRFGAVRLD